MIHSILYLFLLWLICIHCYDQLSFVAAPHSVVEAASVVAPHSLVVMSPPQSSPTAGTAGVLPNAAVAWNPGTAGSAPH